MFKKCREVDDVLFVDASAFEKQKNQNALLDEHIDAIVDVYRERREEEKFSHRATLAEIAENDYNLNIPRYVDTFEPPEPVDLAAVSAGLKALDRELAENAKELAGVGRLTPKP